MWRQNTSTANPDSDQSISDEEEFERDWPENCISLGGAVENKGGLQLPSKLEILRGTDELKCRKKASSPKKQMRYSLGMEDAVEMPASDDDADFLQSPRKELTLYSDEEMISDDDENNVHAKFSIMSGDRNFKNIEFHSFGSEKQDEAHSWSAVNKETEALVRLHEHASCSSTSSAYSKSNKHSKGVRGRIKPKFLFRFQSHKGEFSCPISKEGSIVSSKDDNVVLHKVHEVPQLSEVMKRKTMEHPKHESYEHFEEEKKNKFEIYKVPVKLELHGYNYTEHSMAELLDGLQDNTGLLGGCPKLYGGTKRIREQPVKISTSTLGDSVDNEDPPEPIGSGSSSNDEDNDQKLKLGISEFNGQTMADRFQEALGAARLNNEGTFFPVPKTSAVGWFGKLQQVMQTEKETDTDFLKKLQSGPSPNDAASCIDVKILSRFLDAKLTVCRCYVSKNRESLQWPESYQTTRENTGMDVTVVFNSRLCGDVELEVGNLIRIHSPWKEVKAVGNDESVILSTYFSQISITLDIMILSAKGLKYVKHFSKMDVYAVVKISGDPNSEQKTRVDKDGGSNPTWDFPVQFTIDESSARRNNQALIFQLRCDRTIRGDKDIGEVRVPLKELLDNTVDGKSTKVVSYQVKQSSGKPKGELKFSYKFGDRAATAGAGVGATNQLITPVTAYPAHTTASYPPAGYPPAGYPPIGQPPAGYPMPSSVAEHGCPPYVGYPPSVVPSGFGNPSPVPQYGYQVVQPERKNELELELEAALVGVIGALLAGELVADAPADYDAGLDNGGSYPG